MILQELQTELNTVKIFQPSMCLTNGTYKYLPEMIQKQKIFKTAILNAFQFPLYHIIHTYIYLYYIIHVHFTGVTFKQAIQKEKPTAQKVNFSLACFILENNPLNSSINPVITHSNPPI